MLDKYRDRLADWVYKSERNKRIFGICIIVVLAVVAIALYKYEVESVGDFPNRMMDAYRGK